MDKKEMRQKMQKKRSALTTIEMEMYSEKITQILFKSSIYQNSKNICIYQAFRNEVSCDKIMELALKEGKQIFVPVTDAASRTMEFYQITADTCWIKGAYGIREPVLDASVHKLVEKALILMPGLVFDEKKHRIGYGGGYYDKYLATHTKHITAALCYHFQVIADELPYEEHDILPDYIVTDKKIF